MFCERRFGAADVDVEETGVLWLKVGERRLVEDMLVCIGDEGR